MAGVFNKRGDGGGRQVTPERHRQGPAPIIVRAHIVIGHTDRQVQGGTHGLDAFLGEARHILAL